jgi:hypothetical protein
MADKNTRRSYVQVYGDAMRRAIRELTAMERDVLDYLVSRASEIGTCFPGIADIAAGVDQRCEDVIAVIESLVNKGYVLYVQKDKRNRFTRRQEPNVYQISLDYVAINPEHYAEAVETAQEAFQVTLLSKYDSKIPRESGIYNHRQDNHRQDNHLQESPTGTTVSFNHRQEAPSGTQPPISSNGGADAPETPDGVKSGVPGENDHPAGIDNSAKRKESSATRNESPTPSSAPPPSQKWLKEPPAEVGYTEPLQNTTWEALASQIYDEVVSIHGRAETSIMAARCLVYNYPLHAGLALIRLKTMRTSKPNYAIRDAMAILTAWTRKAWQQEQDKPKALTVDDLTMTDEEREAWIKRTHKHLEQPPASENVTEEMTRYWRLTLNQLEYQLDRGNFDTWVKGAQLVDFQDGVYIIAARNKHASETLQHRLYPTICRVFSDVVGTDIELLFVSPEAAAGD